MNPARVRQESEGPGRWTQPTARQGAVQRPRQCCPPRRAQVRSTGCPGPPVSGQGNLAVPWGTAGCQAQQERAWTGEPDLEAAETRRSEHLLSQETGRDGPGRAPCADNQQDRSPRGDLDPPGPTLLTARGCLSLLTCVGGQRDRAGWRQLGTPSAPGRWLCSEPWFQGVQSSSPHLLL